MVAEPTTRKRLTNVPHPSGDARFRLVDRTLERFQFQQDALIEVLHTAQEVFGYLDEGLLIYVARQLRLPLSWVYGVATFYHFFSLKPQGEHTCIICMGTACYVKRAADILTAMQSTYAIEAGQTRPLSRQLRAGSGPGHRQRSARQGDTGRDRAAHQRGHHHHA